MKRSAIHLVHGKADAARGTIWPARAGALFMLCAAAAVALLLVSESRLPVKQHLQTFEMSSALP